MSKVRGGWTPGDAGLFEAAEGPVEQLEEALPVELDTYLGVGRLARHAVEVADGLAARELALALDVNPHRARLQQARLQYGSDRHGVVQRRGIGTEGGLVGP